MAPSPPLWRRLYDTAERAVAPRLETLVRTEHFARGTAMATRAQATAQGAGGRALRTGVAPGEPANGH